MTLVAKTEADMHALGQALAHLLQDGDVIALNGTLGAGKTQFVQGVGEGLGIKQKLVSPTFNIVFEYASPALALYHFDLYRLDSPEQLEDIDFYELSDSQTSGAALIEWAELFSEEMPEERLDLNIDVSDSGERTVSATAHGKRAEHLLKEWVSAVK